MTTDVMERAVESLRAVREEVIHDYEERLRSLDETIAKLEEGELPAPSLTLAPSDSISDEKLKAVKDLLAKRGTMRQADITRLTGLNSGSVSVALNRLKKDHVARKTGEKDRGSFVWEAVKKAA